MKTWLITGCSAGLGKSLAKAVLKKGDRAVVTARKAETLSEFAEEFPETALVLALDVTDEKAVTDTVKKSKRIRMDVRFGKQRFESKYMAIQYFTENTEKNNGTSTGCAGRWKFHVQLITNG